jgi:hypothetical protein
MKKKGKNRERLLTALFLLIFQTAAQPNSTNLSLEAVDFVHVFAFVVASGEVHAGRKHQLVGQQRQHDLEEKQKKETREKKGISVKDGKEKERERKKEGEKSMKCF